MHYYLLGFIILIGVLVFFHELGHFLVARLCGVGVETFSLGFGKRLWGFRRGMTDYRISAIPLGGYVKMYGDENPGTIPEESRHLSFLHKPALQKIAVVAAGPLMNFALAIILFACIAFTAGETSQLPYIKSVKSGSPAEKAGLRSGDLIVSIDKRKIDSVRELQILLQKQAGQLSAFIIKRDNEFHTINIRPEITEGKTVLGDKVKYYAIGVSFDEARIKKESLGAGKSILSGIKETGRTTTATLSYVGKMISGNASTDSLGGPIAITQIAGRALKHSFRLFAMIVAVISINLGLLNLLPIPVLDGGHLVYFTYELIMGKPMPQRIWQCATYAGLLLLIMLMVFAFYNDIARIFS